MSHAYLSPPLQAAPGSTHGYEVVDHERLSEELSAPGVPDLYQGTELWSEVFVDPDNRRPVSFRARERLLVRLARSSVQDVLDGMEEGIPKLFVVARALDVRRRRPRAVGPDGAHAPLRAEGPTSGHVVAFARGGEMVVAVPRLSVRRGAGWDGTTRALPPGGWRDAFTREERGGSVELPFARFPVALLERS